MIKNKFSHFLLICIFLGFQASSGYAYDSEEEVVIINEEEEEDAGFAEEESVIEYDDGSVGVNLDGDDKGRNVVSGLDEEEEGLIGVDVDSAPELVIKQEAVVNWVADGDTIKVKLNGRYVMVRLLGIDTPESKVNEKCIREAKKRRMNVNNIIKMGREATNFTKSLIKKKDVVQLEFDERRWDEFKRLLAYVYLADGRMLNEEIVKAGYAEPFIIPPNEKYEQRFLKAYSMAKKEGRGLGGER